MKQFRPIIGIKWNGKLAIAAVLAIALSTSASALRIQQNEAALNAHKMLSSDNSPLAKSLKKLEEGFLLDSQLVAPVTEGAVYERYADVLTGDNLFSAMTQEGDSSAVVIPYTSLFGQKYIDPVKDLFGLGAPPEGKAINAQHLLVDSSEKLVMDWLTFTQNESKQLVMKYMETRSGKRVVKEALFPEGEKIFNLTNAEINILNVVSPPPGFMLNLADDTAFKNIYIDGDALVSVNGTFNELNLVRGASYIASRGNGTLNVRASRARAYLDENATVAKAKFVSKSSLLGDNWGDTLVGPYVDPTEVENSSPDKKDELDPREWIWVSDAIKGIPSSPEVIINKPNGSASEPNSSAPEPNNSASEPNNSAPKPMD